MPKTQIVLDGVRCERCAHQWVPRLKGQEPRVCPACKSPYWNIPRRKDRKSERESDD